MAAFGRPVVPDEQNIHSPSTGSSSAALDRPSNA
jgi:hypothetical protein